MYYYRKTLSTYIRPWCQHILEIYAVLEICYASSIRESICGSSVSVRIYERVSDTDRQTRYVNMTTLIRYNHDVENALPRTRFCVTPRTLLVGPSVICESLDNAIQYVVQRYILGGPKNRFVHGVTLRLLVRASVLDPKEEIAHAKIQQSNVHDITEWCIARLKDNVNTVHSIVLEYEALGGGDSHGTYHYTVDITPAVQFEQIVGAIVQPSSSS